MTIEYEAHFFDLGDNVFHVAQFEAEHGEAARSYPNEFSGGSGKRYKLWHQDRLVQIDLMTR